MYKILIVDDNEFSITIARATLENTCTVVTAPSSNTAFSMLENMRTLPDLILLDVDLPGIDGFQTIKIMKERAEWESIPVIFLTAQDNPESELVGLSLGAVDYIKKPFSIPLLKKRIHLHLQLSEQKNKLQHYNERLESMLQAKTQIIMELQSSIINTVADLIGKRDGYTGGHVIRVEKYMRILLEEIVRTHENYQFDETQISTISFCSKLHDVGKIGIRDDILLKNGELSDDEREIIYGHTLIGAEAIENSMNSLRDNEFLVLAHEMVKSHHEKWNGTGYPEGLKGEEIPFVARVMAIADVYDALSSVRPYKNPIPHEMIVEIFKANRGEHFDPRMLDVFLRVEQKFKEIRQTFH